MRKQDPFALADRLSSRYELHYTERADAAALLRTQHAAIERKDALLRQALAVLNTAYGDGLEADKEIESVYESITSELAK